VSPRDRLRLERGAAHLDALGPRAIAEFLAEIGADNDCTSYILDLADLWRGRLTPDMLRATGGDRFPRYLHEVAAA
jgi:hypothetical protein